MPQLIDVKNQVKLSVIAWLKTNFEKGIWFVEPRHIEDFIIQQDAGVNVSSLLAVLADDMAKDGIIEVKNRDDRLRRTTPTGFATQQDTTGWLYVRMLTHVVGNGFGLDPNANDGIHIVNPAMAGELVRLGRAELVEPPEGWRILPAVTGQALEGDAVKDSEQVPPQPKRKRGRPADTNLTEDSRIFAAWDSEKYRTFDELATELQVSKTKVAKAVDRERKRRKRDAAE